MDTLFGEGQSGLKVVLFVIVVLGLLALAFWLLRQFGGGRLVSGATRGRQPRLAVIDQATVDGRRRLVLIRRDNVEHLLIIGGPSDVVVEQNIVRAATAGVPARPPAADTLPRAVPLGEDSMWPLQPEPQPKPEPQVYVDHIRHVIQAAKLLGVGVMNTFVGRDWTKSVDDNWPRFLETWRPLVNFAADHGVKIGIENCPMSFTKDEWPGGKNLMTSPRIWRRAFEDIPSPNFGLNFDPSHLIWQMIDAPRAVREFGPRIHHVHAKDLRIDHDKLFEVEVLIRGDRHGSGVGKSKKEAEQKAAKQALEHLGQSKEDQCDIRSGS